MISLAWLVPLLPAVAFLIIIFLTRPLKLVSALTAIAAMTGSFIISAGIIIEVLTVPVTMDHRWRWLFGGWKYRVFSTFRREC